MALKAIKTPPLRGKRTKAEVQKEFEEIQDQVEDAREMADEKSEQIARLREADVRQAAGLITIESVVQKTSELGLEIGKGLAGISEQLTEQVRLLATVREAVLLERKELEQLHKIDVAATSLDQMIQHYAREKQRLETEIAAQRQTWEEESSRIERERKEQDEALKKQRQRETEDYEYKKLLERKKAQDRYEEEVRLAEKKNQERQESLEKGWQQREAALKEHEEELLRLRRDEESFPARLQSEADSAALRARQETGTRFEQQLLVLTKDAESEKRLAELRIRALEETVAHQAAQIATLEKYLAEAKQQVQDIAVKAIEGASGAKALAHINQIAMEQAKTRPQG
jgi:colicin import membrane protein